MSPTVNTVPGMLSRRRAVCSVPAEPHTAISPAPTSVSGGPEYCGASTGTGVPIEATVAAAEGESVGRDVGPDGNKVPLQLADAASVRNVKKTERGSRATDMNLWSSEGS